MDFGKDTVNGVAVKNLRHLVEMLRDCRQQMVVLEFADHGLETMVFPHQEMLAATAEVLTANGIRSSGSPDLLAVWGAKAERRADAEMSSLSNWSVL